MNKTAATSGRGTENKPAVAGDRGGSAEGSRFAIVRATFYADLAERLTVGAMKALAEEGVGKDDVDLHDVPGAFELPLAAKACALSGRYAAVVCLGAVIRGETDHYDYVCAAAANGIEQAQLDTGVPCAFGLLTVESMEQALARAGGDKRDQGYNAARTAAHMSRLLAGLRDGRSGATAP
jgi:6,7-dimethyl-8-ribityllumazine synthase